MNMMKHLLLGLRCSFLFLGTFSLQQSILAQRNYTEQTPKYQQHAQTNSLANIRDLETQVVEAFRTMVGKSSETPKAVVIVSDQDLNGLPDSNEVRNLRIGRDIEADLQQMLRAAGLIVFDSDDHTRRCIRIEVRLGAKAVQVHEMEGVVDHFLPDIQAKARTSWDGRIVGQAQTLQFLGRDAQAFRLFERTGLQNLTRAIGIMLLYDFVHNNVVDTPLTALDSLTQVGTELSLAEYQKKSMPGPTNSVIASGSTNQPVSSAPIPAPGGGSLLAAADREQVLKQVIDALKAGKS